MRLRRSLFTRSLVAAVLVSITVGWWWSRDDGNSYVLDGAVGSIALNRVSEGNLLAEVDLEDARGNTVSTNTFIGQPLILNFWFTTCEPCRREFPVLVTAAAENPRLRFVGINMNDSAETALAFAASFGATFDMFFDRNGRLTSAMGVATAPVTLLVDSGGVVRRQLTGEVSGQTLAQAIREVFPS